MSRPENQARVPWGACWPLILYFFLTFTIAASVFFVDQKNFGLASQEPSDSQPAPLKVLQSYVTTLLSLSLTMLRFMGALSVGTITWRCIYFLMGKEEGIPLKDIKWILGFGLPTRSQRTQRPAVFLVAAILLTAFPSQFSSPILTGSISWVPSTYLVQGLERVTGIPSATPGDAWKDYRTHTAIVNVVAQQAAGLASAAWGNPDNSTVGTMVRVLPTIRLPDGAELASVLTPYFKIDSVEWVQDAATVSNSQIDQLFSRNRFIPDGNAEGPLFALIPDSEWGPTMGNTTFPHASIQSKTSTLVVLLDHFPSKSSNTCSHTTRYFGEIPPEIGVSRPFEYVADSTNCYAFASVTYQPEQQTVLNVDYPIVSFSAILLSSRCRRM
jgi:hypothetical protein